MKWYINSWVDHHYQVSFQRINEMEPEELAVSVRRAEQIMLPIIQELKPSAGASLFLLAQYPQVLVTGTDALTLESAKAISSAILALWKAGYYTPGPDYPFTLQETLQELEKGGSVSFVKGRDDRGRKRASERYPTTSAWTNEHESAETVT